MRLLVTGGRTGYLGRHVVRAAAGHDVVAVGSADADVRDPAAVDALVDRHRPDAVVHTAYVQADWHVTATGSAYLAVAAARQDARMVLVSSDAVFSGADGVYAESAPPDPITAYGAAKAALHAFGQSMALALAPHDIAVSSVAPGFVATERQAERIAGAEGEALRAQSPFGRVGTPEEVAAAVLYLASAEARWASGTVLDLNGASYLRT